ncbi:MAG TPA: hypothetical protein V6C65_04115 [Allocoleopsis sp.]
MMDFIIFVSVAFGLSNILAKMKISRPLRITASGEMRSNWVSQMIACCACNGFWIGVGLSLLNMGIVHCHFPVLNPVLDGFAASCWCWLLFSLADATGVYEKH